jgi:TPR repeat protein
LRNPSTTGCEQTLTSASRGVTDRSIRRTLSLAAASTLLLISSAHSATFEQGMEAYDRSDYESAFGILDDLALDGDSRALAVAGALWEQGLGTEANLTEALRYFDAGARRDNPRCMVALGRFLRDGIATTQDAAGAVQWFTRAIEFGDNDGAFELARLYLAGSGIEKAPDKALTLLRDAASNGHTPAQNLLAELFSGAATGDEKAPTIDAFIKAAEEGDANLQAQLAYLYESGAGVERNYARAFYWYQQAALHGHADAQASLGYLFQTGLGVEKNLADAKFWYEKALVQEHPIAQSNLAYMYLKGEGVARDDARAFKLYAAAAEQGNAQAQNNLGSMYQRGQGVPADQARALALFREAAGQGSPHGQTNLGYAYQSALGVERNLSSAAQWYQKAAEKNYPYAQANLGFLYQQGTGVEKDIKKALTLYRQAAKLGSSYAQRNLGRAYRYGLGVSKDLSAATRWYAAAADNGDNVARSALTEIEKKN